MNALIIAMAVFSVILAVLSGFLNIWLAIPGLVLLIFSIIVFYSYNRKKYIVKCTECDEEFKVSQAEMFGKNTADKGIKLPCPKCKKETECIKLN